MTTGIPLYISEINTELLKSTNDLLAIKSSRLIEKENSLPER
jgi:hypothetical protein